MYITPYMCSKKLFITLRAFSTNGGVIVLLCGALFLALNTWFGFMTIEILLGVIIAMGGAFWVRHEWMTNKRFDRLDLVYAKLEKIAQDIQKEIHEIRVTQARHDSRITNLENQNNTGK